ncbi:MFS transporter [Sphaerotilus mobilis]|uniref:Na+/melibiose symporter-like transporter n=1 Tax=Sphaerotilus mobilis TaxID=47994 RepID=A0A4Q7L9W6_9BURK|nr:MFS transporter [Sphaerotilus mobilis]RZS46897.1 Na+/melibiose symporter-like transporter [Sphaerotilus mobilis]
MLQEPKEPEEQQERTAPTARRTGLGYGLLGLPLAFIALPLYVLLPHHYADRHAVPLAALGLLLLAVRLADAVLDPALGRLADRLLDQPGRRAWQVIGLCAALMAAGFWALFHAPSGASVPRLLLWCGAGLVLTYLAYSLASIVHQAWGARLGGSDLAQARRVAWREGAALLGVMVASVLPSLAGLDVTAGLLALLLLGGWWALRSVPDVPSAVRPAARSGSSGGKPASPWALAGFRPLLAVYMLNGIASAIPATLVLFFVRDRLQAPAWEGAFLAIYFAAGALSLPLWLRLVALQGLVSAWLAGMLLAVATFAGAALLGAGDVAGFLAVCAASGLALGADLAVPGALLAGVARRAQPVSHPPVGGSADRGAEVAGEGACFGWWNAATKMNLALSAGLVLPALDLAGYRPGVTDASALTALSLAYAVLPCLLKLAAAALLWRCAAAIHPPTPPLISLETR